MEKRLRTRDDVAVERLGHQIQSAFKVVEVAGAIREQARRRLDMTPMTRSSCCSSGSGVR